MNCKFSLFDENFNRIANIWHKPCLCYNKDEYLDSLKYLSRLININIIIA